MSSASYFVLLFIISTREVISKSVNEETLEIPDPELAAAVEGFLKCPNNPAFSKYFLRVNVRGEVRPAQLKPGSLKDKEPPIAVLPLPTPTTRINEGWQVERGDIPYIIGMQIDEPSLSYPEPVCGGTIYNSVTVITAAHCFYEGSRLYSPSQQRALWFTAGEHDVALNEEPPEQRIRMKKFYIHPKFSAIHHYYDIAVVTLAKPLIYNEYVQPIPLDGPPAEKSSGAVVSGWGYFYVQKPGWNNRWEKRHPAFLRATDVEIFSRQICYNTYKNQPYLAPIIKTGAICAGERPRKEGGLVKDSCPGDSGGPLACIDPQNDDEFYLCGIVSTGLGCGFAGLPGVYTRVADFRDWIEKIAGKGDKPTIEYRSKNRKNKKTILKLSRA